METLSTAVEQLELRKVGDHHELDVRAVPYDVVTYKVRRPERILHGAFAGAQTAASKIRLTDENHSRGRRPVGVATRAEERPDGLYMSFRMYNTPEGRSALENVTEQTYGGVSIGFVPLEERMAGGIREIVRANLGHVSLVDEPAYEDAEILAVRSAEEDLARYEKLRRAPQRIDMLDLPRLTSLITSRRRGD